MMELGGRLFFPRMHETDSAVPCRVNMLSLSIYTLLCLGGKKKKKKKSNNCIISDQSHW